MTEVAWNNTRILSEGTKQADIASAMANLTGAAQGIAVRSAERRHRARVWQAAAPNGLSSIQEFGELHADPAPPETFTRTDGTAFTVIGWKYTVSITATWNGGNIVLQDSNNVARLTWTSNGAQTIELPYGSYSFAITTASGVTATVKNGTYTDGVSAV